MNKRIVIIGMIIVLLLGVLSASAYASGMTIGNYQPDKADNAKPIFCRLALEDESELKQIVLADTRIQELIKGKDYAINVRGQSIQGKDWGLDVGAVLKDDVKAEELNRWLDEGRTDKGIVKRYVGVLCIGYNDVYDIAIDADNAKIARISGPQSRHEPRIPELTKDERRRAVMITMDDPRVQGLLTGKNYIVAPEGRIVVWCSSKDHRKIGVRMEIWLDQTYPVEYDWFWPEYSEEKYPSFPHYQVQTFREACEVKSLIIRVDLEKGEVVGIKNYPLNPGMEDLYNVKN